MYNILFYYIAYYSEYMFNNTKNGWLWYICGSVYPYITFSPNDSYIWHPVNQYPIFIFLWISVSQDRSNLKHIPSYDIGCYSLNLNLYSLISIISTILYQIYKQILWTQTSDILYIYFFKTSVCRTEIVPSLETDFHGCVLKYHQMTFSQMLMLKLEYRVSSRSTLSQCSSLYSFYSFFSLTMLSFYLNYTLPDGIICIILDME